MSRPNCIDIACRNYSRPNSMDLNGHAGPPLPAPKDFGGPRISNKRPTMSQVRRSVSMDPKEEIFAQQRLNESRLNEFNQVVSAQQQQQQPNRFNVGHIAKCDVSCETTSTYGNRNLLVGDIRDPHDGSGGPVRGADTSAETSTEPPESCGSTVTATASSNGSYRTRVPEPVPRQCVYPTRATTVATTVTTLTTATCLAQPKSAKYEIIAVRERHGQFRKAVPCMPVSVAVVFCILNVITPGVGTLAAGFTVLCGCPTEHGSKMKSLAYNIVAAILQLVTAPFVIGWVWSIMWGVTFVNVSVSKGIDETIVTAHV